MITAIIPAMNRKEELERCLASIAGLDVEVIVVDNGSRDGTCEMVKDRYPSAKLIANTRNEGASRAKNQGAAAAQGEILWFLDSDTIIPNGDVSPRAAELLSSEPAVGAVGGEIYPGEDGRRQWRRKVLLLNGETKTVSSEGGYGGLTDVDYLPSCNLFMRRSEFEELGGFDPDYHFLVEDTDLCYRLRRTGRRCVADDRTAVVHCISLQGRKGDLYLVHRNRIRFALLNFPIWRLVLLPALDLLYSFRPYKLQSLWSSRISAVKHVPPSLRTSRSRPWVFPLKLAAVGGLYVGALAAGYAWNLRRLPQTLSLRYRKRDFLSEQQTCRSD
jgi:GT2 family glycosyltransferase